uniref:Uncharacterized protein n=1 Tax=Micrurus corallinus TaxID=54390 RepID=A0A2D4G273_MICCO
MHNLLLSKLEKCGIDTITTRWICYWLTNLYSPQWNYIHMEGISGFSQGSILGPVLFNIFINKINEGIEEEFIKFANNTKLAGIANTPDDNLKIQKEPRWCSG